MLVGHYFGSQALLRDGSVLGWGNSNAFGTGGPIGALGHVPTPVELPAGITVDHLSRTEDYFLMHGSDKLVYTYGRMSYGGTVHPETGAVSLADIRVPTAMVSLGPVTHIAGFAYTGHARRDDGTLVLWGGSTVGGNSDVYRVVRNSFANNTTTNARQPLTELVMPGTERSLS